MVIINLSIGWSRSTKWHEFYCNTDSIITAMKAVIKRPAQEEISRVSLLCFRIALNGYQNSQKFFGRVVLCQFSSLVLVRQFECVLMIH